MKRLLLAGLFSLGLLSPVWASEEIGRQEDTPNADGQVLMPIGCVRQDAIASSTSTDGDYGNIKCNNVGRAYISATVDAALPTGANSIGTVGLNTGVNSIGTVGLNAGANGIGSVTTTSQVPGTGATNLGKAEDNPHVSGDTGVSLLCVRHDTSTIGLGVDGDYAACAVNANGAIYTVDDTEMPAAVSLTDNTANPTVPGVAAFMMCFDGTTWDRCLPGLSDTDDNSVAFSQITSIVIGENYVSDGVSWVRKLIYLEDAAATSGDQLTVIGAKRTDTPAGQVSADGDYGTLTLDSLNSLWVNCRTGCAGGTQFAEDVAASNADVGSMVLAKRTDTPAGQTSADGDYGTLTIDSLNSLWVNCRTGCGAGTQFAEDSVAANLDTGTMVLAKRTDTPAGQTSADGDYGTLTLDSLNSLWVNCRTGCAGGTQFAEDAASANADVGTLAMARRTATPANTSGSDLDYETLQMNGGRLWVSATVDAALPAGGNTIGGVNVITAPFTVVEDAAETAGGTGVSVLNVRRDTPATSSNANGDNSTFNSDALGLLWTRDLDPCNGVAKTFVPINISTATTTQLVAASASNFVYVCSLNIGPTAGAQNIALIEDDTAACASPTAGMAGGTTAASGWNIAANGGHNFGVGSSSVAKTAATNRYVCLISSAAVQTSGVLSYVLAP